MFLFVIFSSTSINTFIIFRVFHSKIAPNTDFSNWKNLCSAKAQVAVNLQKSDILSPSAECGVCPGGFTKARSALVLCTHKVALVRIRA